VGLLLLAYKHFIAEGNYYDVARKNYNLFHNYQYDAFSTSSYFIKNFVHFQVGGCKVPKSPVNP